MSKPRPGTALTDNERLGALLSDAIDQLESEQAIEPRPSLEAITDTIRFVRDMLARSQPVGADQQGDEVPF